MYPLHLSNMFTFGFWSELKQAHPQSVHAVPFMTYLGAVIYDVKNSEKSLI